MGRPAEIGNIQIYPQRPLRDSDKNGFVLKFFCPVAGKRVRKNAGTRDRKEARRILRECRERLLNGKYAASGGAITVEREKTRLTAMQVLSGHVHSGAEANSVRTWTGCVDRYLEYKRNRVREKTYDDIISRLNIATRIFVNRELDIGKPAADTPVADQCTLESMEYLQDRLLQGDECRYEQRAHMTVNTTMGAIMSFVRYCRRHRWISEVPPVERLDIESPMKAAPLLLRNSSRFWILRQVLSALVWRTHGNSRWKSSGKRLLGLPT